MKKYRTVAHIDGYNDGRFFVTVSGVELPPAALEMRREDFPEEIRDSAAPGKVFFAYANLTAATADEIGLEKIEAVWGETDFPLHFDDAPGP